jgi:hypothetical protein
MYLCLLNERSQNQATDDFFPHNRKRTMARALHKPNILYAHTQKLDAWKFMWKIYLDLLVEVPLCSLLLESLQ